MPVEAVEKHAALGVPVMRGLHVEKTLDLLVHPQVFLAVSRVAVKHRFVVLVPVTVATWSAGPQDFVEAVSPSTSALPAGLETPIVVPATPVVPTLLARQQQVIIVSAGQSGNHAAVGQRAMRASTAVEGPVPS